MFAEIEDKLNNSIALFEELLAGGYSTLLAYSGGKDSEVCLGLWLNAALKMKKLGINMAPQFLVTADTLVENPEVDALKKMKLAKLKDFCALNCIPLEVHVSKPSLMSSWQARVIGGRGLPTMVTSNYRQCTHELKIDPNNRTRRSIVKSLDKNQREKLFTVLGSRDDEGFVRSANIKAQGGAYSHITKNEKGESFLYPIKHMFVDDVWYFLTKSGQGPKCTWQSYIVNHEDTINLYKDSAGECVMVQADTNEDGVSSNNHGSCGARHGCWTCLAMGDGGDKSMEQLLEDEKYAYMRPLNSIRNYLSESVKDLGRRRIAGRTIKNGHIKLAPDCLSAGECRKLLKACLTADHNEKLRAQTHSADWSAGRVKDTEYNRKLCLPQFEIISMEHLLAIDWNWMLIGLFPKPFEALKVYQEVYEEQSFLSLPAISVERQKMPAARYLAVGDSWYDNYQVDGLYSPLAGIVDSESPCLGSTVINTKQGYKEVQQFQADDCFSIDTEAAIMMLDFELDYLLEKRNGLVTPKEGVNTYLRYGAISVPSRMVGKYDEMIQRGSKFRQLGLHADLSWEDVVEWGISEKEYKSLSKDLEATKVPLMDVLLNVSYVEFGLMSNQGRLDLEEVA